MCLSVVFYSASPIFSLAYMSSPAHINLISEEVGDEVEKPKDAPANLKLSKKQIAQRLSRKGKSVPVGGGV
jgi:hypothetical protein